MKYGIVLPYTTPRVVARLSQLAEESGWDATEEAAVERIRRGPPSAEL
ncbi:MAG TPA: hypothetical protein VF918_20640 [Anaerolineales bacterium]